MPTRTTWQSSAQQHFYPNADGRIREKRHEEEIQEARAQSRPLTEEAGAKPASFFVVEARWPSVPEVGSMPIEIFKEHSFSPDVIQTLVEALDIAWKALQADGRIPPEQTRERREELARHILDMAKRGDYTADVLAAYAVAKVGR